MNFNGLVSWLSFDDSPTNDFCGKTVTAYGNPVIVDTDAINGKALQLDGSSYLKISDVTLGGKDFYIDCWVNVDSSTPNYGRIFSIYNPTNGYVLASVRKNSSDATKLDFWANAYADVSQDSGYTKVSTINSIGSRVHVKLLYILSSNVVWLFINDKSAAKFEKCPQYNRQTFDIYVGATLSGKQGLIGTIDELRIYDGNYLSSGYGNPPTAADYDTTCTLNLDTERVLTNASIKAIDGLVSWLPFDTSTTQDLCGNAWTASGSPTIQNSTLNLPGSSSYLAKTGGVTLGGKNFTIRGKFNMASSSGNYSRIFQLHKAMNTTANVLHFYRYEGNASVGFCLFGTDYRSYAITLGKTYDFEFSYDHSAGKLYFFLDGSLRVTVSRTIAQTAFNYCWLGRSNYSSDGYYVGTIDEFQIYDGVALHTANFTPPTDDDYVADKIGYLGSIDITLNADTQRVLTNAALTWRYENPGDADDLIVSSTVLTDLPATQSATGTAFYQTQRVKCFDLAATPEVWMKFDVYFDGSNRWRAFNDAGNDYAYNAGVMAQTTGYLSLVQNSAVIQNTAGICKTNQLQTVLLHMISGSTTGVIEAWVDGSKIYTYTGDVNHGSDFADLYLQSDGSGTFFSNVIISNVEIGLDENATTTFYADTERKLANAIELYADTERQVYIAYAFDVDLERNLLDKPSTYYNVWHGGERYMFPLSRVKKGESFTVYWNGTPRYNELVDPSDPRAGIVHLWHNSREWALSNQINVGAAVPATRQSSDTYQNYHYDFVKRNFTGRCEDWTCEMSGDSASIYLPDEFNDRPKVNLTGDGETLTYGYGYDIVISNVGEVLELDVYEPNFSQRELAIDWTTKITQNYITSQIYPQITGMSSTDAFVIDDDGGAVMSIVDGYDLNAVPMGGLLDYDLSVTSVEDVELVEGTDWIIGSESVVSLSPTAVANNPDGVKVSYKTYSVVDYDGSYGNSQGLAKPALEPAVRQSSVYYQNYQRDFAGPFELDTEVGDDVWTWYVASASSYIQLPDEFENLPVINIIANDELANYNDIEADEGVPYANYYKAYGGSTPDRRYVAQISFSDEGGDNSVYTAAIQFSVQITQTNITAPFYNKYDVDSWIDAFIINDDGGAYMFVDSYVDLNASAIGGLLYHDAYVTAVDDTPLERDTDWIIGGEGEVSLSPAAVIKNPQGVKISYKTYSVVDYDDSYGEPQSITTFLPWTVPDGY